MTIEVQLREKLRKTERYSRAPARLATEAVLERVRTHLGELERRDPVSLARIRSGKIGDEATEDRPRDKRTKLLDRSMSRRILAASRWASAVADAQQSACR